MAAGGGEGKIAPGRAAGRGLQLAGYQAHVLEAAEGPVEAVVVGRDGALGEILDQAIHLEGVSRPALEHQQDPEAQQPLLIGFFPLQQQFIVFHYPSIGVLFYWYNSRDGSECQ